MQKFTHATFFTMYVCVLLPLLFMPFAKLHVTTFHSRITLLQSKTKIQNEISLLSFDFRILWGASLSIFDPISICILRVASSSNTTRKTPTSRNCTHTSACIAENVNPRSSIQNPANEKKAVLEIWLSRATSRTFQGIGIVWEIILSLTSSLTAVIVEYVNLEGLLI